MNPTHWIARCAARLQQQWPRIPSEQIELAREIRLELERQNEDAEQAAQPWLRQGIPDA
jgi:hypothetical protein